ncbi:MAG: PqqD family protein [Novosphingobium sp.]
MGLTDSYEPAGQDIVSEEIEGEVIIVNLKNGNYYSLTQSGTEIWASIEGHESIGQMHRKLQCRYAGEAETIEQDLAQLIQALEAEELIVRLPAGANGHANGTDIAEPSAGEKEPYAPPMFERFTDMGDLLLLDPVHEVEDQKGWPHAKDQGSESAS